MGCGCRKNNRPVRMKALEDKSRKERIAKGTRNTKAKRKVLSDKFAQAAKTRKLSICNKCPHSIPNQKEKKAGVRVCHKIGRYTFAIAADPKSVCPKGQF